MANHFQTDLLQNILLVETIARIGMSAFFGLAILSYGYTLNVRAREVSQGEKTHLLGRISLIVATGFTVIYGTLEVVLPVHSITTQVYTSICLVLAICAIFMDRDRNGLPALTFLASSFSFLLATVSPFLDPKPLVLTATSKWFLYLHILSAVLGEAIFVIAFLASLIYLRNYRNLKKKKFSKTLSPTSLSSLEKLTERLLLLGLTFITFSLLTGIALIFFGNHIISSSYIKIFWAFLVWMWYVFTIFGRSLWGLRGRRGAQLTIFGMILLLLGLVGTVWQYF